MTGIEEILRQAGVTLTIKTAEGGPDAGVEVVAHLKRLYSAAKTVEARSDITMRVIRPTLEEAAGALLQAMLPLAELGGE